MATSTSGIPNAITSVDIINDVTKLEDLTNHSFSGTVVNTGDIVQASLRGAGSARVKLSGTWVGTVQFEITVDGTTWDKAEANPYAQQFNPIVGAITFAATAPGIWGISAAAFQAFRVRASSMTSGSVTVNVEVNHAPSIVNAVVSADGIVDPNNTTIVPLAAGATFTGASTIVVSYVSLLVNIFSDTDSAATGCFLQFSIDNVNWDISIPFLAKANTAMLVPLDRKGLFFRVIYKNGGAPQGAFRLVTTLQRVSAWIPSHLLTENINISQSAVLTNSVMAGRDSTNPSSFTVVKVDPDGTLHVALLTAGTSAITSISGSITSQLLLAANPNRKGAVFYNDSTSVLYLALDGTASTTNYTVQLVAGAYFEMPVPIYTGAVNGIWATANGAVRITETS